MSLVTVKKLKEQKVAHLELNFVEKRNILSLEMIQNLTEALESLGQDPHIQLLILSGAGGAFLCGRRFKMDAVKRKLLGYRKPQSGSAFI